MRRKGNVAVSNTVIGKGDKAYVLNVYNKVRKSVSLVDKPKDFVSACAEHSVPPSARQLGKWKRNRGVAIGRDWNGRGI